MYDDVRMQRLELDALLRRIDALSKDQSVPDGRAVVRTAIKDSYPTTPNSYFWCEIQSLAGVAKEGEAAAVGGTSNFVLVYNVGTSVPPVDTVRIAHKVGGRYTMSYNC